MDFFRLAYSTTCEPFYQPSLLVDLFFTCNFIAFAIPVLLMCVSFVRKELLTLLFSLFSFANLFVNFMFRKVIIQQPVPRGGCTMLDYGMPSLEAQQAFFLLTFFFSYIVRWKHSLNTLFSRVFTIGSLLFYVMIVLAGQCFLGGNTPFQLFVGALTGILLAYLSQCVVYYWISPRFPSILRWRIIRALKYRDDLCGSTSWDPDMINYMNAEGVSQQLEEDEERAALKKRIRKEKRERAKEEKKRRKEEEAEANRAFDEREAKRKNKKNAEGTAVASSPRHFSLF